MKIDFRTIEVEDIEGNKSTVDYSKVFGNAIFQKTGDIGELEIARKIYLNGVVDLTPEQAESLKKYAELFVRAIHRLSVVNALSKCE